MKVKRRKLSAVWDLWEHGVTQSFIRMFRNCREHCRLAFKEGWRSKAVNVNLEFGNIFHFALGKAYNFSEPMTESEVRSVVKEYQEAWMEQQGKAQASQLAILDSALGMAQVVLPVYFEYWQDDWKQFKIVESEKTFQVFFEYPDGKVAPIVGRRDLVTKDGKAFWLFEHKTKSRIDDEGLQDALPVNFQVNLYEWSMKEEDMKPKGCVYNVIRHPGQRLGANERLKDFYKRVRKEVEQALVKEQMGEHYFPRWTLELTKTEMQEWYDKQFAPVMIAIRDWYEGKSGTHYFNDDALFTVYGKSQFFDAITKNDYSGLVKKTCVFNELEDL